MSHVPPPPPPSPAQASEPGTAELLQALNRITEHLRVARLYLGVLVLVFVVLPIIAIVIIVAAGDSGTSF